jgi:hypothetical protein
MTDTDSVLGYCPQCDCEVPRAYLLIEYQTENGKTGLWAECPECADVIDPT